VPQRGTAQGALSHQELVIPTGGECWVSLVTAQATGDFDEIPTVIP